MPARWVLTSSAYRNITRRFSVSRLRTLEMMNYQILQFDADLSASPTRIQNLRSIPITATSQTVSDAGFGPFQKASRKNAVASRTAA